MSLLLDAASKLGSYGENLLVDFENSHYIQMKFFPRHSETFAFFFFLDIWKIQISESNDGLECIKNYCFFSLANCGENITS